MWGAHATYHKRWKKERLKAHSGRLALVAGLAGLVAPLHSAPASAVENFLPYLPGLTIGFPVGALPSGLLFANSLYWFNGEIRNNDDGSVARISAEVDLPIFCYNTGFKILGASYGVLLVTPLSAVQVRSPLGGENASGAFNPYIAPIDLSWRLSPNLFVSAAFGVYLPVGAYSSTAPLNIANDFTTFEPALGVTYFKDGWSLSTSFRLDVNTVNPADHYHSGSIAFVDYSAEKQIGNWKLGLGGYVADQFTDDTIDDVVAPASASNGLGHKAFNVGLGPIVEYDFGKSSVALTYQHDFAGRNYGSGDDVFLRFATELF